MRYLPIVVLCLAALALGARPIEAAVVNGGFEGGFHGWQTSGSVATQTATYGEAPTQGAQQALAVTDAAVATDAQIEAFLGLPAGSLDTLAGGNAIEGAAFRQTFHVNAGDVLTFDWNFLTDENTPDAVFNDLAFWSLTPVQGGQTLADTTFATFAASGTPFNEQTGYQSVMVVMPVSGLVTLGFGVLDVGDAGVGSGLLVDNVAINGSVGAAVPEPTSLAVWGLATIALGRWTRRRSRKDRHCSPKPASC